MACEQSVQPLRTPRASGRGLRCSGLFKAWACLDVGVPEEGRWRLRSKSRRGGRGLQFRCLGVPQRICSRGAALKVETVSTVVLISPHKLQRPGGKIQTPSPRVAGISVLAIPQRLCLSTRSLQSLWESIGPRKENNPASRGLGQYKREAIPSLELKYRCEPLEFGVESSSTRARRQSCLGNTSRDASKEAANKTSQAPWTQANNLLSI